MRDENLRQAVIEQREELTALFNRRMFALGETCTPLISDRETLETELARAIASLENCRHLFVLDRNGVQITDNITQTGSDPRNFGRDRSRRPYVRNLAGHSDFLLSDAYIGQRTRRPMVTAVQVMRGERGKRIGYLAADFDLRQLPGTRELYSQANEWRQIKGDPAIRGGLFAQIRAQSVMDDHIDDVLSLFYEMITEHGVFHIELHFSSSRAIVWLADDPYAYRIFEIEELINPNICLALPKRPFARTAALSKRDIHDVFGLFRALRFADETIYLRSGSLNLHNGLASLHFSCDGSHYVPCRELIDRGLEFWLGEASAGSG